MCFGGFGFDEIREDATVVILLAEYSNAFNLKGVGIVDVECPHEHTDDVSDDFAGVFVELHNTQPREFSERADVIHRFARTESLQYGELARGQFFGRDRCHRG